MSDIRSILFVELLGGIGDVLIALPAIHALGRSHPSAQLTVLTFAPGGKLLETDPLIHRVLYAERGQVKQAVEKVLEQESFDVIVSDTNYDGISDLLHSSKTQKVVSNLWRSPPHNERVGDRFLNILLQEKLITTEATQPSTIHLTQSEKENAKISLGAAFRPLIFMIPDAGMDIKQWSPANMVALGQLLQQQHNATLAVVAGSNLQQAEQIAQSIGGAARVWQSGTLRQLAAAIANADLVIGVDTGPARIAAALNIPTITLFGPSWHGRYGHAAPHINIQGFPECLERKIHNFTEQICWYSGFCPFEWNNCVEDISPADVAKSAAHLLTRPPQDSLQHSLLSIPETSAQPADKALQHVHFSETDIHHSSSIINTQHSTLSNPSLVLSPSVGNSYAKQYAALNPQHSISSWQTIRRLLVMRLDNIGDVIMTSPALRALKESLPQAHLTLMASPGGAQVAPLLPWVDDVIPWRSLWQDLGRLAFDPDREWELVELLKRRQFDAAIIFTSFSQSPHPPGFICGLAGIPLRLGESKEQDFDTLTHTIPSAPDELHQVERNLRLIESVGFQVSDRSLSLQIPPASIELPFPYILLNPWTSCQSRNYDTHRFAIAAQQLSDQTGLRVVVTGVEKDRDRAEPVLKTLGDRAIDLIGKTTLGDLTALVAKAKLVLTNNTSTMHIADATRTPNVILFAGTEQESQWCPRHSASFVLRRPTVCSPCYAFNCPYHLECLDITPEVVVEAGLKLLKISIETA